MNKFIVHEGEVLQFDGINLPDSFTVNTLYVYGQDWIVVEATNEADALRQADLYDADQHPAQTEMRLFAATLTGTLRNDESEALNWAGWKIHPEDITLDHVSFTTDTDWVKENDEEVYDVLHDIMEDFVADEQNSCDDEDMENFEAGNWKVEYLFRDGEAIYTAGRDGQHLANQDGWSRDKIPDIEPEKIALYKSML